MHIYIAVWWIREQRLRITYHSTPQVLCRRCHYSHQIRSRYWRRKPTENRERMNNLELSLAKQANNYLNVKAQHLVGTADTH